MSAFLRVLACVVMTLAAATASAQQPSTTFSHSGVQADAKRYETFLRTNWNPGNNKNARDLAAEGQRLLTAGSDFRASARSFAYAVVLDPSDADSWTGLARSLLAIKVDQGTERYELPVNASGAALIAYERAKTPAAKSAALWVLHDALKRRSYWRPAIDALKLSVQLNPTTDGQDALDKLVAEHGFRITEYKVDADAAQPRLCIQFSERLAPGTVDWAQYFKVNGKDPQTVNTEQRQICLDGFKHGERYEVQVRAGLPSAVAGETLLKTAEMAVYVKDRSPSVRATGRGYVLPNRGQQGIPLVTVNTNSVVVDVYRIGDRSIAQALQSGDFQRQISSYELGELKSKTGARVYTGELAVENRLNEDVTTAFPVAEAIPQLQPGVYVLAAHSSQSKDDSESGRTATQWFVVSDLGLTAITGEDGIHGFVRSLATAAAVPNANVRLLARNNEVLATGKTDSRGYVRFDPGLARGEGGQAPAVLVADTSGDYAFLDMTTAAFDLTDRGVKGRAEPGPIDGFIYADRGVYRPGETVHLTSLVRTRSGSAASVPVTLIISRPDGVEHSRMAVTDQGLGGRASKLVLASTAMTGTWRAKVYTDPKATPIANVSFLVEDFVPERLELKLEPAVTALNPQQPGTINVSGRYLYGPPAAGLTIEAEIAVKPSTKDVPGFAGYKFGLADEQISAVRQPFEKLPVTDADGKAILRLQLPALAKTNRPLDADLIIRLRESGGRTIERTVSLPIDMKTARIGIKPLFKDGSVGEGETANFQAIVLGPDGKPVETKGLKWELLRLEQRWQWYSRDGSWAFEPVTSTRRAASGTVDSGTDTPAQIAAKVDWGRYRLEVSDSTGLISSVQFNAGYWAEEGADSPEVLDVALDKPSYKVGDIARVKITSRMAGRAMVAVLSSGLLATEEADLPAGGGEIQLKVDETWNPGAYVTVALYRPMDEKAKRMPSRAMGLRWLPIDQSARTVTIGMEVPEKVRSGSKLVVPVKISGLAPGEQARVTVAATDVGILNLTRFEVPKPDGWFFGQRRLGSDLRDLYGRLIDGMRAERGKLRSGGDGGSMSMQGSPPVEETLALFSGIVEVAADGTAQVQFDLPDFNGLVRLTAVAWSADKVGSGSKDVIVRDQVAVTASTPRFLILGDQARVELALHNVEGQPGPYTVTGQYETEQGTSQPGFERSVTLAAGERKREAFQLKAAQVGLTKLNVRVTGPGGVDVQRTLTFDVKVPAGDIRRLSIATLAPKGGKMSLSRDLVQDLIPSRTKVTLTVGPHGGLDMPGLLTSLDRYPYGCAEQTTSRALPLLYVNDVAKRIGLATDTRLRERVEQAIARVLEMQDASGAFGIWGPSDGDMWLTSYVTDFLTRAKEAGYTVRKQALDQALDRLANYISYAQDFESGGEGRAYALYVLARNGRAPIGELRYYVDTKLEAFSTPLARAQLGAALAMMGDKPRAERALRAALDAVDGKDDGAARRDYGTSLRDSAAIVTLASETGVAKTEVPRMVELVSKVYATKTYTSTQEQAWMVMAARALADEAQSMALTVNGQPHQGQLIQSVTAADLQSGLTVANVGDAPAGAIVSVSGAALTPEPAITKGITVERTYYSMDGKKIDLKSATGGQDKVKQNDRFVVVLKVEAKEAGGRILLVDRLPAGLEIENPRLVDSGDIKSLSWLKTTLAPQHTEFRDDRFVAAFDFFGTSDGRRGRRSDDDSDQGEPSSGATVAYIVRAVTPGTYVHPAATAEDMYRPDRFGRTAAGRWEGKAKE